ncbi:MAG TPA: tetratricopeptide repeat protein [Tepidisphaeraceae bacterium]|nr:tetratricopeptide repeat protein [Tepidisphaeraceae bacterium]
MSRATIFLLTIASLAPFAQAQHEHHGVSSPTTNSSSSYQADLGKLHHPVLTKNAEAQKAFDQGLTLIYAFNHDEAVNSFKRALALDPDLAMAHWGIALALGPNYNLDVDPPREKEAYQHIQQALKMGDKASEPERDYIKALAVRYSNEEKPDLPALANKYRDAMRDLAKKYSDDLDAQTLYADSMMVLHPWQLYTHDGKPQYETETVVATLESVLKRNPDHVGANHLYIHAVEASTHPERAMPCADRLPTLAPAAGHLVHMPAHIYSRTGDYDSAATSNEAAIAADETYLKATGAKGFYSMMYYSHNMHFLSFADAMQGRFDDSKKMADRLEKHTAPMVKDMPMLEGFAVTPIYVLVRFNKWDDILKLPMAPEGMPMTGLSLTFARGMAYAAKGDVLHAKRERELLDHSAQKLPADAMFGAMNKASAVMAVAINMLDARIAIANQDHIHAMKLLTAAANQDDKLIYDEPPAWWLPPRETLGAVLLKNNHPAEAEKVFREELEKNPRSGRALYGLIESLKAQKKDYAATLVQEELNRAWKNADTKLTLDAL